MKVWGRTELRSGPDSSGCRYICEWYTEYGAIDSKPASVFHIRNVEMGEKDYFHYAPVFYDRKGFIHSITEDHKKGILSYQDYCTCLQNVKMLKS